MATLFEKCCHWLYALNYPPQKRTRPMEVIAVGISRSGTESLRQALEKLGVTPTLHGFDCAIPPCQLEELYRLGTIKWADQAPPGIAPKSLKISREQFDRLWGDRVAITDMPAAKFSRELIMAYPEAKVVLNTRRDLDAWYNSFNKTLGHLSVDRLDWDWCKSWFCAELFWTRQSLARSQIPQLFNGPIASNALWVYEEHTAMVKGLGLPPEKLLEWSVEDGWEPLCEFLGKQIPKDPFPRGNNAADFDKHVGEIMKGYNDRALRNMSIFFGLVTAVAVGILALC